MNNLLRIWRLLYGYIGTGYGAAVTLAAFVAPASLYLQSHHYLPNDLATLSPILTLIVCLAVFLTVAFASLAVNWWRERNGDIDILSAEVVEYKVYPYEAGSELRKLSAFAYQAFGGDTMDAEVVQSAVAKGAAIGLRITDVRDDTIGFVDVFHLVPDIFEKWKKGQIAETDLKEGDFHPIPQKHISGAPLALMFGAIYLKRPYEPGLPFQIVDIGEAYLRRKCAGFSEIALFATIFSTSGRRLAQAYGFTRNTIGAQRLPYGGGHDLWVRKIRPNEWRRVVRGLGGSREVVVTLEAD